MKETSESLMIKMQTLQEKLDKFYNRLLSWSSISSFKWDKVEWYDKYILDKKTPPNPEMLFGSKVGKKLEKDPTFLPQIKRHSAMEYEFTFCFAGITCTGFADTFCRETKRKLDEYKTGVKEWDQERVDEHGQIDMYVMGNYIRDKIPPEEVEITLWWMPTVKTVDGDFKTKIEFVEPIEKNIKMFKTKRTMMQILKFGQYLKATYKEMEDYIKERHSSENIE